MILVRITRLREPPHRGAINESNRPLQRMTLDPTRRRRAFIAALGAASALLARRAWPHDKGEQRVFTVVTFGDSILDCGRYNAYGAHPGQLLVRNDDPLFPDYRGRDLASDIAARLEHRARDGGRVDDL